MKYATTVLGVACALLAFTPAAISPCWLGDVRFSSITA